MEGAGVGNVGGDGVGNGEGDGEGIGEGNSEGGGNGEGEGNNEGAWLGSDLDVAPWCFDIKMSERVGETSYLGVGAFMLCWFWTCCQTRGLSRR